LPPPFRGLIAAAYELRRASLRYDVARQPRLPKRCYDSDAAADAATFRLFAVTRCDAADFSPARRQMLMSYALRHYYIEDATPMPIAHAMLPYMLFRHNADYHNTPFAYAAAR